MGILKPEHSIPRPPVVAVMGHIDHGKSTLLDYIRQANVTDKEAGGITQHVSAYEVVYDKENGTSTKITFLDTPGHEAFQGIRTRGASVADIGILIVSAEDGVKPQTLEAYQRIKEKSLPYIVAITKIDKPSANVDRAKQSLAEHDIFVEGYGGDIPVVAISAKTGEGVKELLEMICLIAELENFRGDPTKWGTGIIIESRLNPKVGITAVGVIKDGTVKKGMVVASVGAVAPLRYILDADSKQVDALTFSSPIQIVGWDKLPPVGAVFELFEDKKAAELFSDSENIRHELTREDNASEENNTYVPLVIKADAAGSLEAIKYEISKLSRERINPRIILSGVGTVSENDMKSALSTPDTIVLAFNTKIDPQAANLAERSGINLQSFDIIYKLTEYIAEELEKREPHIEVEETTGTAKILRVFSVIKDKQVIGARVTSGALEVNKEIKIIRREAEIGRGRIKELQQNKIAADHVTEGNECGTLIESKIEIAPGDMIEALARVTK